MVISSYHSQRGCLTPVPQLSATLRVIESPPLSRFQLLCNIAARTRAALLPATWKRDTCSGLLNTCKFGDIGHHG